MSVWRPAESQWWHSGPHDDMIRYNARGEWDRRIYRNMNGDWVLMHDVGAGLSGFKVYRWRWLARLAADWWL